MLNIALFGPPGAGKGTQSELIIKEYKLFYISTGDLLRLEMANNTRLGREAREIIASGGLVSDEIIVQIIEKTIQDNRGYQGFLFDGFPRTRVQAYILEGLMIKLRTSLNCLISLEVDEETSVLRLLNRGKTSGRSDDNETVIRNRLKEYHDKTLPVKEFYRQKGILRGLDGTQGIDAVQCEIRDIMNREQRKNLLNIVMFGYPGSGRGSQGMMLAEKYGLEYVATGRMLESEIEKNSPLGQKVKALYEEGQLVPDEIVIEIIEQKIEHSKGIKGFVFKGYPRTLVQSYILDGLLQKHGSYINMVMDIEVPTLQLITRLAQRSQTQRCMPYDTSTTKIANRLQDHETKTVPVIQKYEQVHGVIKIDGRGSQEEVFARIEKTLLDRYPHMAQL